MEVILLDKVENLGGLGDKVKVRSGYGRNFLIPQGKAVPATAENLAEFEKRRADLEAQLNEELKKAETRKAELEGKRFEVRARAGEEGKLFGSVGTTDVVDALKAAGIEVERREVRMPDTGPIHELGEFEIGIHLHSDVDTTVTIAVVAEE
ncbi:MAG TPA: 50S ribosomal protein L9 [Gammaproteobacteria bacterium]|nr:50S ribosomal protein L9 [Gammaproteobacteria bacterium]